MTFCRAEETTETNYLFLNGIEPSKLIMDKSKGKSEDKDMDSILMEARTIMNQRLKSLQDANQELMKENDRLKGHGNVTSSSSSSSVEKFQGYSEKVSMETEKYQSKASGIKECVVQSPTSECPSSNVISENSQLKEEIGRLRKEVQNLKYEIDDLKKGKNRCR